MRMIWCFAIVISLAQLCATKPPTSAPWDDMAEKHSWVEIPRGWDHQSSAPAGYTLHLRLALKQNKIDDLIASLMETSDPTHSKYGKHLTMADAEALVAPHRDTIQTVDAWLEHHGIPPESIVRHSGGGGWVALRVSVAVAERMLDTKYNVYRHTSSSEQIVRAMSYSLPRDLHAHIDVVTPTTYFGTYRSAERVLRPGAHHSPVDVVNRDPYFEIFRNMLPDNLLHWQHIIPENAAPNIGVDISGTCNSTITPGCLRALYNTVNYVPAATDVNKLGVPGYYNLSPSHTDLQEFLGVFLPEAVGTNYTTVQIDEGVDSQTNPSVEASLDIQYSTSMTFPTRINYYSTGGSFPSNPDCNPNPYPIEPYLDWQMFLLSQPHDAIPQTITTSYGDDEQTVPEDYAQKVCHMFAILGSIGTSVFFSSGDYGVGPSDCQPHFPASCPWVTAVGGTTNINPEVGFPYSGGGFSRYFQAHHYQRTAVSRFLDSLGTTYDGLYNKTGRAYPDLAAQAMEFEIVVDSHIRPVSGTSASTPTVAGIFTLLNDFRIANGKPPLGFLNLLIYAVGTKAFNDVVSGSNPGCGTPGFTAREGWDPVTGWGTPDFLKLQKLI